MQTSIIIRVKNEKENLEKLFAILKNQTYQDFELVVVDNDSTDGSGTVVYNYFPKNRIKLIVITDFSYPKACNLGARNASGKFLVYLSAHSFPISNTWLADGLSNFNSDKFAGVFGLPIADHYSTILEKIGSIVNGLKTGGELGNTNSIIRKELWEKHKFDERLTGGSEDYEWSIYWKRQGYKIINDPRFRVHHSHHLGFGELKETHMVWKKQREEINKRFEN